MPRDECLFSGAVTSHDGSRLTSPCCSPRGCHWKSFERAKWRAWSVWRISLDLLIRYEWIAKIFCRFLVILFGNISDVQIYLGWWWSFVHMFLEVKLPTRFDRFSLAPRSKYKISLGKSYIAHYIPIIPMWPKDAEGFQFWNGCDTSGSGEKNTYAWWIWATQCQNPSLWACCTPPIEMMMTWGWFFVGFTTLDW